MLCSSYYSNKVSNFWSRHQH